MICVSFAFNWRCTCNNLGSNPVQCDIYNMLSKELSVLFCDHSTLPGKIIFRDNDSVFSFFFSSKN